MSGQFRQKLAAPLTRSQTTVLQINLGRLCNQSCSHCHVAAGPWRTESLSKEGVQRCIALFDDLPHLKVIDLTGGAPELHSAFRELVVAARSHQLEVIDRCNLTILEEPGQESLATFLAEQSVHVIASLPCYSHENVDRQRGEGVFAKSLRGLQQLNRLGYGQLEGVGSSEEGLRLDLVFNPAGPQLPPPAELLEKDYRRVLKEEFGIVFDRLITLTNMPIARFLADLRRQKKEQEYQQLLIEAFNRATLPGLMCRHTLSVSWDGQLYDCDFNQMLKLGLVEDMEGSVPDLWNLSPEQLEGREIATGDHCFGCTAGQGSSCGGSLVEAPATS
ncbi:MAG: radical SAM protein [Planctomycetia bacterium TMED53]|nr:MAG: radical SAM protein [Planctomycetia bacterium TMED53]